MRVEEHVARVLKTNRGEDGRVPPRAGYVIYSGPYLSNSAGVYCLYKLCDELNRRGFPSFTTNGNAPAPGMNAPVIDLELAAALCSRGFIAIYGETVRGNPLGAPVVVRWVLNRPGLLGGDKNYADSELVFSYSDVYTPYITNQLAGKLHLPSIDQKLFYCHDSNAARSLSCYYVGKSKWKKGFCDPAQTFEITRRVPEKRELGKLLRSAKVLYCFDNSTILIYEALLCGCPVVVIPDGTHTKADFELLELGADGISWGLEEADRSSVDVNRLEARLQAIREQFAKQLERMIELSQARLKRDFDWDNETYTTLNWRAAPRMALKITGRRIARRARRLEQDIRSWRKRQVKRVREWTSAHISCRSDEHHFYCADEPAENRELECYWSPDRQAVTEAYDDKAMFRITPSLSAAQLGHLFRASRRFYSCERASPLVTRALACGCPVTIVKENQLPWHVFPSNSSTQISSGGPAILQRREIDSAA